MYYYSDPGGSMSWIVGLPNNSYQPITNMVGSRPTLEITKKGALDSQSQVIKFTSCLPMVLWLLSPLNWSGHVKLIVGFP
jgi:hypothetical protein